MEEINVNSNVAFAVSNCNIKAIENITHIRGTGKACVVRDDEKRKHIFDWLLLKF